MSQRSHKVDIQTQIQFDAAGAATGVFRYRWQCSAGCKPGRWHAGGDESGTHGAAARRARNGGERHVAAMERG